MKVTKKDAQFVSKFGINLWTYKTNTDKAGFVYTEVEEGHFEEFYHKKSTFIYYILEGEGVFFLDGVETPVKATDLLVIPPNTKIYYFGKMKLNLITVPAWDPKEEVHVRNIKK